MIASTIIAAVAIGLTIVAGIALVALVWVAWRNRHEDY